MGIDTFFGTTCRLLTSTEEFEMVKSKYETLNLTKYFTNMSPISMASNVGRHSEEL